MLDQLSKFRWIFLAMTAVAALRFLLEFVAPDVAGYVGLYYATPIILLVAAVQKQLDGLDWKQLLSCLFIAAFLGWFPMNAVAYTTGQFAGWDFGRHEWDEEFEAKRLEAEKIIAARPAGSEPIKPAQMAEEMLGRKGRSKMPVAPGESALDKIGVGLIVSFIGGVIGALTTLLWGAILIGFPAHMRRRPTG